MTYCVGVYFGVVATQCHVGPAEADRLAKFSEGSEVEVVEDSCQAVQVGLELRGVVKALAVEDCGDRAASEPTRLLDRDQELSDLGGNTVARLCNHHSQLCMLSCHLIDHLRVILHAQSFYTRNVA